MSMLALRILVKDKTDTYYVFMEIKVLQGILTLNRPNSKKKKEKKCAVDPEQHGFELCGPTCMQMFSINTLNVFSLLSDFLNNILLSLAYSM